MNYRNAEMKIDQLVSYLNEDKINLAPPFQRGHVWPTRTRRKLLHNMVAGKPIPAIFLYKEASGSKYSYNILDGKQRLESLILFIGSSREDFAIQNWERYFFEKSERKDGNFWIDMDGIKTTFRQLGEVMVRDFREYAIPTVEMNLEDETSLDEVISLFVDINQQGVPVNRFDIVKAMFKNDPILKQVFGLLAVEQRRGQDLLYRMMTNDFTHVLKRLQVVSSLSESNSRVDRMWEKLLELAIFALTLQHRKPAEILKGFISRKHSGHYRMTRAHNATLRRIFCFLKTAYKTTTLGASRLATDQTHFYIMATVLINSDILTSIPADVLTQKLTRLARMLDAPPRKPTNHTETIVKKYVGLSEKQTTDVVKRKDRESLFKEILKVI
ncbi:MAG: DUF262 domain-containing protein [Planctomycetota bacterium]